MNYLKQSTAATIKLGPFVDDTDGKTAETALTIAQADVRLSKNGGNMAQKNESASATHDELGYYDVTLNATDTGTLGRLKVMVTKSGALPVWAEYLVVTANVFDTLCSTDKFDVNAAELGGSVQSLTDLKDFADDCYDPVNNRSNAYVVDAAEDSISDLALSADAISKIQANLATLANQTTLLGRVLGTIASGTHNPQSGDAYARLGAPAGASVSEDVAAVALYSATSENILSDPDFGLAAVKADTAAILTDTGTTLDTLIKDVPTVAEFNARTLASADYATATALNAVDDLVDTEVAAIKTVVDAVKLKTDNLPTDPADQSAVEAAITAATSTTGVKVASYATGLSPAEQLLIVPSRKLYTSTDGFVDLVDAPNSTAVAAFASAISSTLAARTIDGTLNQDEYDKLIAALLAGLMTVTDNGGGSYTTVWYRQDGTTPAITVDTDATGRTGVTLGTLS